MKLSVCIPVYNVAPYIERCARSLFEQTHEDLEYVFVDDCSTDDGIGVLRRVLAEYPSRAARVKCLRTERNGGPVRARKLALQNATGDLIAFCDSDDWLDEDLYAKAVGLFDDPATDMVWLSSCSEYASCMRTNDRRPFDGTAWDFLALAESGAGFDCLWNKVCRRSALRLSEFEWPDSLRTSEDLCLVVQLAPCCRRIRSLSGTYYHYRQRMESLSRAPDFSRILTDVSTTYDIVSRRLPPDRSSAVKRHLLGLMLYFGARSGCWRQRDMRKWRAEYLSVGGKHDFPWLNVAGRRFMRLASVSLACARLYDRLRPGRIGLL